METINFDAPMDGQDVRGQSYFQQIDSTVCVIGYMQPVEGGTELVNIPDALIAPPRAIKP